ncbi:hypothetical protein [Actinoplanes regularis]|uniref:Uncharacterized protein n=1 Tax=Actinoplanes regularis TaxID=52697 RepID=A0A238ZKQ0_9ACTN|nr:hypothetical protein [Actinoplanes regularis]GIE87657.1 hypothetical protein Are01nite_41370 [Actinoplanes regularis]SNR83253.1 hypothetical protein SAMN06264365_10667 [Actinoplanes regularis]
MELRPELCAPVISQERLAELRATIERIGDLLENGRSVVAEIAALNADTGHDYIPEDLRRCCDQDVEWLVLDARYPARPEVPDITRDEMVEIAHRMLGGDLEERQFYMRLFDANVDPNTTSALFVYPPGSLLDASPEEIVDYILAYRPTPHSPMPFTPLTFGA